MLSGGFGLVLKKLVMKPTGATFFCVIFKVIVLGPAQRLLASWLNSCVVQQALTLLSPERGFPMQKVCTGLLLGPAGSLLAAASDGCCYILDAESLRQESRLPLHPSLTGKPLLQSQCQTKL